MSSEHLSKCRNRMNEERRARRVARAMHVQSVDEFIADKSNFHFGANIPTQANGYEVGL